MGKSQEKKGEEIVDAGLNPCPPEFRKEIFQGFVEAFVKKEKRERFILLFQKTLNLSNAGNRKSFVGGRVWHKYSELVGNLEHCVDWKKNRALFVKLESMNDVSQFLSKGHIYLVISEDPGVDKSVAAFEEIVESLDVYFGNTTLFVDASLKGKGGFFFQSEFLDGSIQFRC
ncbi:MAG TPA: hypothetical protein ENK02_16115 [Planctomycetes bacterium]|nr:hypothetical protein [Planctomycetota bacterium]